MILYWYFGTSQPSPKSNVVGKQVDSQLGSITMGAIDLAPTRLNNPIIKVLHREYMVREKHVYFPRIGTHTYKNGGSEKMLSQIKQSR